MTVMSNVRFSKMLYVLLIVIIFALANCQQSVIQPRIINGHGTDISNVPYLLMLTYKDQFICGAVLITPKHILTAAHCLYSDRFRRKRDERDLKVYAGVTRKSRRRQEGHEYGVRSYVCHPVFVLTKKKGDIAIIFPSKRVQVNGITIKPIKMATRNYSPGYVAEASGWGLTDDKGTLLDKVQVTKIKTKECPNTIIKRWAFPSFDDSICARGTSGVCRGDSGGPLVYRDRLVGIARATGTCTLKNEIYTSVDHYSPFINLYVKL